MVIDNKTKAEMSFQCFFLCLRCQQQKRSVNQKRSIIEGFSNSPNNFNSCILLNRRSKLAITKCRWTCHSSREKDLWLNVVKNASHDTIIGDSRQWTNDLINDQHRILTFVKAKTSISRSITFWLIFYWT